MKQTRTIEQVATELDRMTTTRHDYAAPASQIDILNRDGVMIPYKGQQLTYKPTDLFETQVAGSIGFPIQFFRTVQQENQEEWRQLVNARLHQQNKVHLVRCLDGQARAFLGNGYFPIDNADVAKSILQVVGKQGGWEIAASEITPNHMYIRVLTPLVHTVKKVGDKIRTGFQIHNSEVGAGAYELEEFDLTLRCLNGAVGQSVLRRVHLGQKLTDGLSDVQEIFSRRTQLLSAATLFSQTQDAIRNITNPDRVARLMAKKDAAADRAIDGDVSKVLEVTEKQFGINLNEGSSVMDVLISQGLGSNQYALSNAITQVAAGVDDYDRSVELERIGGQVMELGTDGWQRILHEAGKAADKTKSRRRGSRK